jgi:hypothetical protein
MPALGERHVPLQPEAVGPIAAMTFLATVVCTTLNVDLADRDRRRETGVLG